MFGYHEDTSIESRASGVLHKISRIRRLIKAWEAVLEGCPDAAITTKIEFNNYGVGLENLEVVTPIQEAPIAQSMVKGEVAKLYDDLSVEMKLLDELGVVLTKQ